MWPSMAHGPPAGLPSSPSTMWAWTVGVFFFILVCSFCLSSPFTLSRDFFHVFSASLALFFSDRQELLLPSVQVRRDAGDRQELHPDPRGRSRAGGGRCCLPRRVRPGVTFRLFFFSPKPWMKMKKTVVCSRLISSKNTSPHISHISPSGLQQRPSCLGAYRKSVLLVPHTIAPLSCRVIFRESFPGLYCQSVLTVTFTLQLVILGS